MKKAEELKPCRFFLCCIDAVVEGRSAFPVYASAYALQAGLTDRSEMNIGSASNVGVSRKYLISEAEIPRYSFLRWGGLQRRLDWKCTSSYVALVNISRVIQEVVVRKILCTDLQNDLKDE
ncbi:hypothetical protein [Brevibacillus formosus]|uniref:hypothetical protein n=1 Tax=Brevibacillus formosus TaxID=54913 RepID=UPI003F1ABCB5